MAQTQQNSGTIVNINPQQRTGPLNRFDTGTFQTSEDNYTAGNSVPKFNKKGEIDILRNYRWTLTNVKNRDDIPYIRLEEHECNESMIKKQVEMYIHAGANITSDIAVGSTNFFTSLFGTRVSYSREPLNVYSEMYPDSPTGNYYTFPYFNKTQYELSTPQWQKVDGIGEALKGAAGGTSRLLKSVGLGGMSSLIDIAEQGAEALTSAGEFALKLAYPVIGVADRPSIFTGHNDRSVTISFPLYNTVLKEDWIFNKDFYTLFASQNLFNKVNFITGRPPVFYRVYVPGQYFSYASCVTNFTVENLGHVTIEKDLTGEHIVPDAYQITITLQELLMPSLNQFASLRDGTAQKKVNVT